LLSAANSLAPVADLNLRVEFRSEPGNTVLTLPVQLTSSQLRGKQAMISVALQKFPRRIAAWQATWLLEDRVLEGQRIRAISKAKFQRSLRISETRYVLQSGKGEVSVARQLPARDGLTRVGPCFLVSSSEAGMAGLCKLQVRALVSGGIQAPLLLE